MFHNFDHAFCSPAVFDEFARPSSQASRPIFVSTSIRYAEHTVNTPFLSCTHSQKSSTCLVQRGMERIACASDGKNTCVIVARSHSAPGKINAPTCSGGLSTLLTIGRIFDALGTQLCSQICVVCPSPIRRIRPCTRTSRPSRIDLQI